MKKVVSILAIVLAFTFNANAQDKAVKTIALEQTPGEFTEKGLTVSPGTYVFEISNNNAAEKVGLVLVKKGDDASKPENHIQTAYVTAAVTKGKTEKSNPTTLEAGEYVYFCPLNPTPQYTLTVQ